MLVRAVNHLHSLGKTKAIAELREFVNIAGQGWTKRDPADIETSDYQCVFLIVRLLFEPQNPSESRPWMAIGAMSPTPRGEDQSLWPMFPLAVQDDLPFILINGVFLGGLPEHPYVHVDWAEKNGRLRAKPLRPADDPIAAVERLASLPQTRRLFKDDSHYALLRRQAWETRARPSVRQSSSTVAAGEIALAAKIRCSLNVHPGSHLLAVVEDGKWQGAGRRIGDRSCRRQRSRSWCNRNLVG